METPGRTWGNRASTALALSLSCWLSFPASAEIAGGERSSDGSAPAGWTEPDYAQGKASDLLITTHDATGKIGVALPLEIKLVRARNVSIEAIKLLGLPRGVTISDSSKTFSAIGDGNDVDVTSWDLSKIQIVQSDEGARDFSLAVAAIWSPEAGGHIDVTSSRLNVRFVPDRAERGSAAGGAERRAAAGVASAPPAQAVAAIAGPDMPAAGSATPEPPPVASREEPEAIRGPAPSVAPDAKPATGAEATSVPKPAPAGRSPAAADPLVERAKGLIRLGDISGARLLLERAQAREAPNATFLLAQTWDPAMHRTWKVHGLRSDQALAQSLYAKAARQERADERRLAATGR